MKNITHVRSWLVVVTLGVLLAVAGCGSGGQAGAPSDNKQAAQSVTTVKFGSVGGLTDAGLYIADAQGYFKAAGIKVEMVRMSGGSEISSALATGNLDVGGFAITAGLFNSVAQGVKLKIVGDKQSILPKASATRLVANKSLVGANKAATIRNLRGKIVTVSDKTSNTPALLDWVLAKQGMSIKDIDLRQMGYPEMTAALLNHQVDAAIELEPYLTQVLASGSVVEVDSLTGVVPPAGGLIVPLVYSQDFIGKHHDKAQAFMIAYMKGVRVYNDAFFKGKNKDAVAQIIAQGSKQPLSLVLKANVAGLDPNQRVSNQFLVQIQDWFVKHGLVQSPVKVSDLVDPSFADQAVKELGEYK